jgi:hypothetical protein
MQKGFNRAMQVLHGGFFSFDAGEPQNLSGISPPKRTAASVAIVHDKSSREPILHPCTPAPHSEQHRSMTVIAPTRVLALSGDLANHRPDDGLPLPSRRIRRQRWRLRFP